MLLDALTRFCDSLVSTVEAACNCSIVAPSVPRCAETVATAALIAVSADCAAEADVSTDVFRARVVVVRALTAPPMETVPPVVPSLVNAETVDPKIAAPLKFVDEPILPICVSKAWNSLLMAVDWAVLSPVFEASVASVTD